MTSIAQSPETVKHFLLILSEKITGRDHEFKTIQCRKAWDGFKAFYIRQFLSLFWTLAVAGIGLILRENVPWLETNVDFPLMALVSGVIGILISNFPQFGNTEKVLTKNENSRLNLLVDTRVTVVILLLANAILSRIL